MGSLNDKVRKARRDATNSSASSTAYKTVNRNAKTAGVKLSRAEELAAMEVIRPRIKTDRSRTAARAVGIEKMQTKKAAAKRMAAAIGNAPAVKKATPKPTPTPKFTPPSLQDFKKSAGYKTNSLTYKEYVAIAQDAYKAKLKRQQGR